MRRVSFPAFTDNCPDLMAVDEHIKALDKEIDVYKKLFNRRVLYFGYLQEISDSVSPHSGNTSVKTAHWD